MAVFKSDEITKDGRKWFYIVKYHDIFGNYKQYKSKKYLTQREASIEEAKFKINIGNISSSGSITIEQAFNELLINKERIVKPQTLVKINNQYKYISPLGKYKINDLNVGIYNNWLNWFEKQDICILNKNKILGLLKQIINYSSKYYNTSNKLVNFIENFKDKELKKEMNFYTYDEYIKFSSVIDDPVWLLFFDMLYYLGLRQGELCALTWKDIDFNKEQVNINKTITTKLKGVEYSISTPKTKGSNRVLPLSNKLIKELKEHLEIQKKYTDFNYNWFIFGSTMPFKETTIANHKNKYIYMSGSKTIRIHDFRHSCASLLIYNGASITLVSKWLGHSKISMTLNTYTHLYKNELNDIKNLINKL